MTETLLGFIIILALIACILSVFSPIVVYLLMNRRMRMLEDALTSAVTDSQRALMILRGANGSEGLVADVRALEQAAEGIAPLQARVKAVEAWIAGGKGPFRIMSEAE